jgi:hypothetical protein
MFLYNGFLYLYMIFIKEKSVNMWVVGRNNHVCMQVAGGHNHIHMRVAGGHSHICMWVVVGIVEYMQVVVE